MEEHFSQYNFFVTSNYGNDFIIRNDTDLNNILDYVDKKTYKIKELKPLMGQIIEHGNNYNKMLKPQNNMFYITLFSVLEKNNTGHIQNWITHKCEISNKKVMIKNINDYYVFFDELLNAYFGTFKQYFKDINENYKNCKNCNFIINKNNNYYEINFLFK